MQPREAAVRRWYNLQRTCDGSANAMGLNNYDPTTYDVPGRFGYARVSYGF